MLILIAEKTYHRAAQIALGFLAVVVLLTFQHYGISWDEEIQSQYGQSVFDYYASGFLDHRYNQLFNLYIYGGMFDGLAALVDAWSPMDIYDTRHLLNALCGLFGLWGTWRVGRLLGGGQVGLIAMLLLALTPMYYGHMFNNPKDIPFAACVIWSIYYMTKSLRLFPHISLRLILKLSLFIGLTLGIRVGGVMLLGYWGVALGLQALVLLIQAPSPRGWLWFRLGVRLAALVVPVTVLAYGVMLICWPWAQEAPIANPWLALVQFSNFPQDVEVLLNGTIYRSTELPWFYLPLYFAVQLPLAHLALVVLGIVLLPLILRDLRLWAHRAAMFLILLMAFGPMLYAMLRHPALYDAVRHFIFTLPLLCLLAALAVRPLIRLVRLALRRIVSDEARQLVLVGVIGIVAVGATYHIVTVMRLHPYEYIYVNGLQGGVQGAYGKYEMDYWGSSFKEAAAKLQDYVAKEGGIPPGKIYRVAICGPWSSATIYLPPDYAPVVADEPAEFFLSTTRWMCQNMRPGREIIRVERMGVPLSVVKDLRH